MNTRKRQERITRLKCNIDLGMPVIAEAWEARTAGKEIQEEEENEEESNGRRNMGI